MLFLLPVSVARFITVIFNFRVLASGMTLLAWIVILVLQILPISRLTYNGAVVG